MDECASGSSPRSSSAKRAHAASEPDGGPLSPPGAVPVVIVPLQIAMNAASLQSMYYGGVRLTATDPLVGSVLLLLGWCSLRLARALGGPTAEALSHCLFGLVLLTSGVLKHLLTAELYMTNEAFHPWAWVGGVAVNLMACAYLMARAAQLCPPRKLLGYMAALLVVAGGCWILLTSGRGLPGGAVAAKCPDANWFAVPPGSSPPIGSDVPYLPPHRTSQYVRMSDGIELAVDVYLPAAYAARSQEQPAEGLPTFLHFTRYNRAQQRTLLSQFLTLFGHTPTEQIHFPMRSMHYQNLFIPAGYAVVSVDVRGTGASFGSRPVDLIQREVDDFGEVLTWTKNQSFCNGKIGTGGISYDGMVGAIAAGGEVPGISAAALLFAPGDLYEDILYTGGVPVTGFLGLYGKFTGASERNEEVSDTDNELPKMFKYVTKFALAGAAPVFGQEGRLADAVSQHQSNLKLEEAALSVDFRKDTQADVLRGHTIKDFGISDKTREGLVRNGVAVYSIAGYFDSGSVRSALRMHEGLSGSGAWSKLTIGPWTHGCRACYTPGTPSTESSYHLFADVKRLFDCKLKGEGCEAFDAEDRVHYYVSGEGAWRTTGSTFPATGTTVWRDLPLQAAGAAGATVWWDVDLQATSGHLSRWNLVQHLMKKPVTYGDRAEQSRRGRSFTLLDAIPNGTIIEGSPVLRLRMAVNGKDAVVFAYLEEVDPSTGEVEYVTEGVLRASHSGRLQAEPRSPGAFDAVGRSFLDEDWRPLTAGAFYDLDVPFEPVAFRLRPGRSLRVTLAGADADNFDLRWVKKDLATQWQIDAASSAVKLPLRK